MAMEEKAVRDKPQSRPRPIPSGQHHVFREVWVDCRLSAEERKRLGPNSAFPQVHPAIRLVQRHDALEALVGVVRAALASQVTAVNDVELEVPDDFHGDSSLSG
jgi:hypothetical protein